MPKSLQKPWPNDAERKANRDYYAGPTPYMQTDMENQNAAIKASPASRKISADIAKPTKLKMTPIVRRPVKVRKAYQE